MNRSGVLSLKFAGADRVARFSLRVHVELCCTKKTNKKPTETVKTGYVRECEGIIVALLTFFCARVPRPRQLAPALIVSAAR